MNINKLILIIFTIILYVNQFVVMTNGQATTTCTTYVDSSSPLTGECGTLADKPCSTILQSIQSCSVFSSITINIVPGNYSIDNQGTFRPTITNTTISILNSGDGKTPVIIDLSNAPGPFINIAAATPTDSSIISISGITFQNGNQTFGSILNVTSSWVQVSINNCNFINNIVSNKGGSFSFIDSTSLSSSLTQNKTVTIVNSSFSNIKLGGAATGGVIYNSMNSIVFSIDQCTFTNITNSDVGSIAYFSYGMMSMTNSVVSQSISKGAIFMASYTVTLGNNPLFVFENVNFTQGQAGLGFVVASQHSITSFKNCNFSNNNNTGIIFGFTGGLITITSCTFANNYNAYSLSGSSGAVTSLSTPLYISNCQFIKNHAVSGGAINVNGTSLNIYGSTVTIVNSIFTNNSAMLGGAITCDFIDTNSKNTKYTCNNESSNKPEDSGLTIGQKLGIAFGVIGAFGLMIIITIAILRYKKRNQYKSIGY